MPHVLYDDGEETAHTRLLLPGPASYDFLYSLALSAGETFAWKGRPQTKSAIEEVCWVDTFEHAVIVEKADESPLGYVALNRWNSHHGTAYISVYLRPDRHRRGIAFEAIALTMYRMFNYTSCRKIYAETTQASFDALGLSSVFAVEGRLLDFLLVRGKLETLLISSVEKDTIFKGVEPHLHRWGIGSVGVYGAGSARD